MTYDKMSSPARLIRDTLEGVHLSREDSERIQKLIKLVRPYVTVEELEKVLR